ncbi:MAG TPA: hypothetical protein DIV41_09395 [Ruminococcaceae bacterium]|nr:hypothetical protein [Oscillospiraceae bacterium]
MAFSEAIGKIHLRLNYRKRCLRPPYFHMIYIEILGLRQNTALHYLQKNRKISIKYIDIFLKKL